MAGSVKDQQLHLPVTGDQRSQHERAAEMEGVPLKSLVLGAADAHARHVLREHASLGVPSDVFDELLASLDEPTRVLAPSLKNAFDQLPAVVARRR